MPSQFPSVKAAHRTGPSVQSFFPSQVRGRAEQGLHLLPLCCQHFPIPRADAGSSLIASDVKALLLFVDCMNPTLVLANTSWKSLHDTEVLLR